MEEEQQGNGGPLQGQPLGTAACGEGHERASATAHCPSPIPRSVRGAARRQSLEDEVAGVAAGAQAAVAAAIQSMGASWARIAEEKEEEEEVPQVTARPEQGASAGEQDKAWGMEVSPTQPDIGIDGTGPIHNTASPGDNREDRLAASSVHPALLCMN